MFCFFIVTGRVGVGGALMVDSTGFIFKLVFCQ